MEKPIRPRSEAPLAEPINRQLNLYALAASAAGVGLLALTQPAEAKIVYTKTHQVIQGRGASLNLDLNHDGVVDFQLDVNTATDGEWLAAYGDVSGNRVWESKTGSWAEAFPAGVRIGPNGAPGKPPKGGAFMEGFACRSSCRSGGNWLDVKNRYLGLTFLIHGKTHYGWARLSATVGNQYGVRAMLSGYAYETVPGKPIITGKTKGPDVITVQSATLGHLARGAR